MSIFESKPQIFWRKVREGLGRFFGTMGRGFGKIGAEFRALPRGARAAIYIGGSMLVGLLVFIVAFLPMLRPSEPERPQDNTVAETIVRLEDETQRAIDPSEVPEMVKDIDQQLETTSDPNERYKLYLLRAKVYYNAGEYYEAATSYERILEKGLVSDDEGNFAVYSSLFFVYELIGDANLQKKYGQLMVDGYTAGRFFDDGACITYARGAGIDTGVCPSMK